MAAPPARYQIDLECRAHEPAPVRTRPSPDANGLARAYPWQRIETRPPAVGSGDYVANPRFGIQRAHGRTVDYLALAQGPGGAEPATALMPTA